MEEVVGIIILTVIGLILLFLLLRELNCWYWKINERIALQEKQNQLLETLVAHISNKDVETLIKESIKDPDDNLTEDELMKKYNISKEGGKYIHDIYRYGLLKDAIANAKRSQEKDSQE